MVDMESLIMLVNPKFPPQKVIAIDVDKTLYLDGQLNKALVSLAKRLKGEGYEIIIWSARGTAYATEAATAAGLADIADTITGKPGYIVDDKGWSWIKYTKVLRNIG